MMGLAAGGVSPLLTLLFILEYHIGEGLMNNSSHGVTTRLCGTGLLVFAFTNRFNLCTIRLRRMRSNAHMPLPPNLAAFVAYFSSIRTVSQTLVVSWLVRPTASGPSLYLSDGS